MPPKLSKSFLAFFLPRPLLWPVPAPTHLLGADVCSLLARICLGSRKCVLHCPLLKEGIKLLFCSLSKTVWLLRIWKKNLAPTFKRELWVMSWKWRDWCLCTSFTRRHLNPGELKLSMNCDLQLFPSGWLRQFPEQFFCESPSNTLNSP